MMMIETLFLAFLFGMSLFYLIAPFFSKKKEEAGADNHLRANLQIRKEVILAELKDLEFDHVLKKIDNKDYDELYKETFDEGVSVMKQMENPVPVVCDWKAKVERDLQKLQERKI